MHEQARQGNSKLFPDHILRSDPEQAARDLRSYWSISAGVKQLVLVGEFCLSPVAINNAALLVRQDLEDDLCVKGEDFWRNQEMGLFSRGLVNAKVDDLTKDLDEISREAAVEIAKLFVRDIRRSIIFEFCPMSRVEAACEQNGSIPEVVLNGTNYR